MIIIQVLKVTFRAVDSSFTFLVLNFRVLDWLEVFYSIISGSCN